MQKNSRYLVLIGGLAALVCSLTLYGVLALSAMYNQYRGMSITVQTLACENFAETLSRAARLGIRPERLDDLSDRIGQYTHNTRNKQNTESILVLNAQQEIISAWNYKEKTIILPRAMQEEDNNVQSFTDKNIIWLIHAINDRENTEVGYVLFGIDETQLLGTLKEAVYDNGMLFIFVSALACALLILLCLVLVIPQRTVLPKRFKLRFYVALVIPLIFAQCLFTFALHDPLRTMQEQTMQKMATQVGLQVGQDIEHVMGLGMPLQQIQTAIQEYLNTVQQKLTWISGIGIIENDGSVLVASDSNKVQNNTQSITQNNMRENVNTKWDVQSNASIVSTIAINNVVDEDDTHKVETEEKPSVKKNSGIKEILNIEVVVSHEIVTKNLLNILLDTLTITVITFVFMIELLTLLMLREEQSRLSINTPLCASAQFMRPIIFVCLFAISLPVSFIPLRMAEINPDFLGLPIDIVMGIPVSFEVGMVALAVIFGGTLIQKLGWRPLLLWGTGLVVFGSIISGTAASSWCFLFSRALVGMGYGSIDLAAQVFVVMHSTVKTRTSNLATMAAGISAGLLCGSAFGGLIADRFGYSMVFYVAAVCMLSTGITLSSVSKKEEWKPLEATKQRLNLRDLLSFLSDPRMAALLFLNILPCAFVYVCLFKFYIPISLNEAGNTPASIGRVSMLFCLIVVYLGPVLGRIIDQGNNKVLWLGCAGFIGAGSVILLPIADGILIAMFSVTLLGVMNAIASSAQGAHALELPATSRLGVTHSMGIYNVTRRVGQMLGPVFLGIFMVSFGTNISLVTMAGILVCMSIIFILIAKIFAPALTTQGN